MPDTTKQTALSAAADAELRQVAIAEVIQGHARGLRSRDVDAAATAVMAAVQPELDDLRADRDQYRARYESVKEDREDAVDSLHRASRRLNAAEARSAALWEVLKATVRCGYGFRRRLARAGARPDATSKDELVALVRDAGIIRDAEYRAIDDYHDRAEQAQRERDAVAADHATLLRRHLQVVATADRTAAQRDGARQRAAALQADLTAALAPRRDWSARLLRAFRGDRR